MQHKGDLVVTGYFEQEGQVTGTTYARAGSDLIVRGQLAGGLIIDPGARVTLRGQSSRDVVNHGTLELIGQISGRLIGNAPINDVGPEQIVGTSLEVPFRGPVRTWSSAD